MYYETKTVLLQLAELQQELKVSVGTYLATVSYPIKYILHTITAPIKLLTRHLQEHLSFITTPLIQLDPD